VKRLGNSEHPERALSERPKHREQVLYVEDDDSNYRVAELRLSQHYELLRASHAEEACRIIQTRGLSLAAILMDIELRGSDMDGVQLTQLIRGRRADFTVPSYARDLPMLRTPIIFVTAHNAKYTDTHLLLVGGDKVIGKPVDFGALNVALTQLHLARRDARAKTKR